MAGSLIGQDLTIDNNSQAYQQWTVTAGGQLTVNNSRTSSILATTGSSVILNGATLSDNNEQVGVQVRTSTLLMNDSVANGTDTGVIVGRENQSDPRGGSAIINNSQINGGLRGIQVASSELELNNSVVTANGTGIDQLQGVVVVNNSQITAGGVGLIMRRTSTGVATDTRVDLNNTLIESGTGAAVTVENRGLFTSYLNLSNGSSLVGGNGNILEVTRSSNAGVTVTDSDLQGNILLDDPIAGSRGAVLALALSRSSLTGDIDVRQDATLGLVLANNSLLTGDITVEQVSTAAVSLDASQVLGDINVADTSVATVSLANGSLLTGSLALADASAATLSLDASQWVGNIDLAGTSTADVNLANGSQMIGDISAGAGTTANVVLDSGSLLTGRLENLTSLRIDNDAQWQMVETSTVDNLSLNGGRVRFGEATDFQTLNVGDLTGSGTFVMDVDFATGQRDFLNVTGNATGNHELLIASTGADPVDDASLHVVHANAGDASFALVGGSVDLGTWAYGLREDNGTDWYLDAAQKTISPGTASVLALFNTAPTVWYGELSSLRSRMGELRHNGGQSGVWSRAYGGKYNVSGNNGLNYSQQQNGFSLGADAALPIGEGQWLAGVLAGYSDSDLSLARGSSGAVKSYYAGLYTTWLDAQSGYYFDGVLKLNRFNNDSKINLSDGSRTKGSYDNNAVGASAEFGRHIKLDDGYFVEPSAQLATVFIKGANYSLDNGLQASGERTRSLLGKLGATAGRRFDLGEGRYAQPYVRAAYVHEFAKGNKVSVNDNSFNNDLSGSRGELGAGLSVAIADKWDVHADFQYTDGEKLSQPWGANVGVRYSW